MFCKTKSYGLNGLIGFLVEVEVDSNGGMPSFDIVGLGDTAVKESKERVVSAIKNSGKKINPAKITVNLAPADLKKEGSQFDLGIALGILRAQGQLIANLEEYVFLGELSLNGELRHVNGILPMLISACDAGYKKFIIPEENKCEASYIVNADVVVASSLSQVFLHLTGEQPLPIIEKHEYEADVSAVKYNTDLSYIKGQKVAKRALEVAVSGGHNILLVGPPGTGKTMLAKCIPTIMPEMTAEEALEVTKVHSVAGLIRGDEGIIKIRPFRTPHHTSTTIALMGGGKSLRPGEISMAHNGVLFLDEMPEYKRDTLESLRQPLEDGVITISRAVGSATYPAQFILCASMNPCPCGNFGSKEKQCICSPSQIARYKAKISGPLLDRIDIQITVDDVKYSELKQADGGESSQTVRERVNTARKIQQTRFKADKINSNSEMSEMHINKYCQLDDNCEKILETAYNTLKLSARARSRIIKVARTIADMDGSEKIKPSHLLEAIGYRQG